MWYRFLVEVFLSFLVVELRAVGCKFVMALKLLPPGFRFHPTDVELILYYLKRKIMGKKLHYEAIAEVNIYKFSPWDLPG